ncbi:hypothetical protein [Ekhidna sp.]
MKKFIYILILTSSILFTGCFEEYEGEIPSGQQWVYFESTTLRFDEDASGALTTTVLLSAIPQSTDVIIPFTIESESLVEGTDYTTITSNEVTIPAGKNSATVELLAGVINNDEPVGNRSLTITLQDVSGFEAGFPGESGTKSSIEVVILEDDFTIFGFTSFEEPEGLDVDYEDVGSASVSRELPNNPGQAPVQFESTGGEMGFKTFYVSTGGEGATDGDDLGVTTKTSIVNGSAEGGYVDGVQGYYVDDTDGIIRVVFDEIDLSADVQSPELILSYLFNDSNWETEDKISVDIEFEDESLFNLLLITGDDIDDEDLDREGPRIWYELNADLTDVVGQGPIKLVLSVETDSGAEEVYFDNIIIRGIL